MHVKYLHMNIYAMHLVLNFIQCTEDFFKGMFHLLLFLNSVWYLRLWCFFADTWLFPKTSVK